MLAEDAKGIVIKIMGKQHQFACANEDARALKASRG